ncbi:hypothetical protein MNBD_GAMMA22-1547 [hydrothermal vent metagenome]|uniref:Outer membrane protein beta-barrel domain-containing protein n=1 Tax=hydrothermal vent metagenome TaxID=652676 RepID=A0A3B1ADF2_9ZZZZ
MITRILIILILLIPFSTATADELHLIVSGKAIHYGSGNYNENNKGFGFEYDFKERNNWIPLITAVSFLDSNSQTSNYLGAGSKRRFRFSNDPKGFHFDAGILAFVMTRQDYKNNDPFVAALPFVSFGYDWLAINITYVPKIQPKMVAFTYFQASIRLFEF